MSKGKNSSWTHLHLLCIITGLHTTAKRGKECQVPTESRARPPLSLQSPGPGHLCPFRVLGQATFVPSESRARPPLSPESRARPPLSLQTPGPGPLFVPSETRARPPLSVQSPGPGHLSPSPLSLQRPVVNILSLTTVRHGTVVNSIHFAVTWISMKTTTTWP